MTETHPNLVSVSDHDFDEQVLHSTVPVLVEFTAEWCPPCRAVAPHVARLSDDYQGKLQFATMDTDKNMQVPARFGIQGIPTFILFAGGRTVGRIVGPQPGRLQQTIEHMLAAADIEAARA